MPCVAPCHRVGKVSRRPVKLLRRESEAKTYTLKFIIVDRISRKR